MVSSSKSRERFPEKKIPVLSVLQNCSIIKNIFVVGPSDGESSVASGGGGGGKQPERDGGGATEMEEVVTVGRHPDNLIVLTHPSISRFHFKIIVESSSHQLFVTDLASAHGTWVSGKKIEPGVRVEVVEGDTIQIGASTRVYRLHWVPMSRADDMQNPSASSAMDVALVAEKEEPKPGPAEAKQEMTTPQKEGKEIRIRDSDEEREVLSGKRYDGVAWRAASEEFSGVSETSEQYSCEEVSGMQEEVNLESPLSAMEAEIKSESPLPVLAAANEVPMKEEAEFQFRDSEKVSSSEKEEVVVLEAISEESSSQDESRGCYSCEEASDVHDSLDSSLAVTEEQQTSGFDVVEETENQCLVKEDHVQCGMFELESVNLSLIEGKPTENSQQVLFAEGKEKMVSPYREDDEVLEVSQLGTDSLVLRHEEASVRSLIEDQEQAKTAALGSDSENLCYLDEKLTDSQLQQISVCEENEETRVPLRNDNELTEVSGYGNCGSVVVESDETSDSGNLCYLDGKLTDSHLQQVSVCKENEETRLLLINDNEVTEVSNYGTCGSVVVGSEFEDNQISESCFANDPLTEDGDKDLSLTIQGESSDVANIYSSLLFAAVKAHLDREIAMMKDMEPSEPARLEVNLSLTVETPIKADQPQVSLEEGKEEITNDEVIEVPSTVQAYLLNSERASMKDQGIFELSLPEKSGSVSLSIIDENLSGTELHQVYSSEEKEGIGCSWKNNDEVQDDFVDCVSSSMKDQELDSVNTCMMDENLSGTEMQQVSLVVGKVEDIASSCRNDDEVKEVSKLPQSVESLLKAECQLISFEGEYDISSVSINDGEVSEVPLSRFSVENLLEADLQLVSFEGKDGEFKEVAKLPFAVENLLEADLSLVPYEGKDEMSLLSRNYSEVTVVPTMVGTDLGYSERSVMKDQEHVEIVPSEADTGYLPLLVQNLYEADFQQSFVGEKDMEKTPCTNVDNEEVAELPNLATGCLPDVECGSGIEHKKFDELDRSPDSHASLRSDHGLPDVERECGTEHEKFDEFDRSPDSPASLRSEHGSPDVECESGSEREKFDELRRSLDSLASLRCDHGSPDGERESGSEHGEFDELDRSPDSPTSLRSDHDSTELESEDGGKHEKHDELDRSPESPSNLKSDHGTEHVEFNALDRSPEWPSVEVHLSKRLNTEFPASLETEINMDDFDSLMSVESMEGDDLGTASRPLQEGLLGISSIETESTISEANWQLVSFSEARDDKLMETSNAEAGSIVVQEAEEEDINEESSPKSGNVEMESPLRSQVKLSNPVDLDTLFVAALESDLNTNASPAEDQRQRYLDMSLFDSPVRAEAVSKGGQSLDSSRPLDFDSSSPCDGAAVREQEQKMEQVCPVESKSLTSPSQLVNNVNGVIQAPEDHSSTPNEEPESFSICTVSMVTESVSSSSFSIEELLSEIMESEEEESTTPQSVLATVRSLEQQIPKSENNAGRSSVKRTSFWLKRVESGSGVGQLRKSQSMGKISSEETRSSPKKLPFSGFELPPQKDLFTPDKENRSPNKSSLRRSLSSKITLTSRIMSEGNTSPIQENSSTPEAIQQRVATTTTPIPSSRNNIAKLGLQMVLRNDRMPLQNLIIRSPVKSLSGGGAYSLGSAAEQSSVNRSRGETKTKKWIMVVDTASLLDNESRKALQLLQGLRGTRLIIPRIVKNELESLKRTGRLFRRNTAASKVLEWIEECELKTEWWIHVQTSIDESAVPLTPPASPESGIGGGSSRMKWYTPFSSMTPPASPESGTGTTSKTKWYSPFSSMPSLRREDHVLSSALFYKKLCHGGEQVVLISHDPDLLFKAMLEGLVCETAQEFRGSLVNPFSERFLWGESSPRGQTWSVHDDVVLKERYYPAPHRKLTRGETARGLKLILLSDDSCSSDSIKTL
ncbi:unnamed protein product [Linum trigynum]|uniref:FHA domain-containing protein n=1 Tax=Linum trigynum TaxID=586398 RepID=A0AAV2D3E6_9ROSI